MSYEMMKSIQDLIKAGKGDVSRLEHILNILREGKYLYLSDQKYLESLLYEAEREGKTERIGETDVNNDLLNEIRKKLENISDRLEKIENEFYPSSGKSSTYPDYKKHKQKNEDTTLLLSIILGLLSYSRIDLDEFVKLCEKIERRAN